MKISVVMTTYNGEKYIVEQLDSLRNQTRKPDEVIICDDGSTDSTNAVIDEYIDKYSLSSWIHKQNEVNLGWKKNFMNAIEMSTGDIIFTCDQDDIWYESKLEVMEKVMSENPQINLAVSKYEHTLNDKKSEYNSSRLSKYEFDRKFVFIMYPGCVYCFRRTLFDTAKKMWFEDYPHDALIWRQALLTDSLYVYDEAFIYWRRHDTTATGRDKRNTQDKINSMHYYIKSLDKMIEYIDSNKIENIDTKMKLINKCKSWCRLRIDFLESGKFLLGLKLFGYIRNYYNFKSYIGDWVVRRLRG